MLSELLHQEPGEFSPEEQRRYARHLLLPEVGADGQRALKAASVLCVGAGGLGSPALMYLAAAGVGRLGVVDGDRVDESNLQRQILHGTADLHTPKTESAHRRLADLNPHITLETYPFRLNRENALETVAAYDIVVDGSDNFPTRYLVNDACVLRGKPCVHGAIFRFEGQVTVFDAGIGPCYRCLFPEPPKPGEAPSCAEAGVFGVLPGVIGCLQATEVIKRILGIGEPLLGRLLLLDALSLRFRELKIRKRPNCPACGTAPTLHTLVDYDDFCGLKTPPSAGEITAAELQARLAQGEENLLLLDVREPAEVAVSHLPGAQHIPLAQIPEHLDILPRNQEIVVYCRSGGRSAQAQTILQNAGFAPVWNLRGGLLNWAAEIDPSMPVL